MILAELFLSFLKVGVVSFGGGYGMISLLKDETLTHGWISEELFLNYVAISESTPGPIAINMATFIGSSQAGFMGALIATSGVIIPSFLIILFIASVMQNLLKYSIIDALLKGIRPCISGLIISTAVTMILSVIFNIKNITSEFVLEWKAVIIFALITLLAFIYKKIKQKNISVICLIIFSAVLGIFLYGN